MTFRDRIVSLVGFTGDLIGNVTGNATGTAGALASGAVFSSTEQTGTGNNMNIAHGFGAAPRAVVFYPTDLDAALAAGFVVTPGTHTSTNVVVNVTLNRKFRCIAWK